MTVAQKLDLFFQLIENQFKYGGQKYATSHTEKEATDILCERHGYRGLFWVMNKYIFRFRNQQLEKDPLKIGCFCYILWLKRGFHILSSGIDSPILPTNTEIKKNNFLKFKDFIIESNAGMLAVTSEIKDEDVSDERYLNFIEGSLHTCSNYKEWRDISSILIDEIFINIFHVWQRNFANQKEHNEDIGHIHEKSEN